MSDTTLVKVAAMITSLLIVACGDDARATLVTNHRHEWQSAIEVIVGDAQHQPDLMVLDLPRQFHVVEDRWRA